MLAERPCTASTSGASVPPKRWACTRPDARSRPNSPTMNSGQPADLHDHIEVGRPLPRVDALERRNIRIVPAHTDTDVLLVDVAVVGRVIVPPTARPGLNPRVALTVDGLAHCGFPVGMQIARYISGRNTHAPQQYQCQVRIVLAHTFALAVRVEPR